MTDRALVSGVLFRDSALETAKSGKRYAFATVRSGSGEAARWWKCFAFRDTAIEAISALVDGEQIAVAGEFDCELNDPAGGESRLSWKIVADAVLTARREPKPRGAKAAKARPKTPPFLDERGGREFDDQISF